MADMYKILVIEDEESLVKAYKAALDNAGFEVVSAVDGDTGLKMATTEKPDLIILDQLIPGMVGVDVLEYLGKDPDTAKIPVIVSSNIDSPERRFELAQDGAVSFVLKSNTSLHEIIQQVKDILKAA